MSTSFCSNCGTSLDGVSPVCPNCNTSVANSSVAGQAPVNHTVYVQVPERQSNTWGTVGLVFSILAYFSAFLPVVNWLVWLVGLICSFVGVFKKPKGCAIAGLILSSIGLIFLIVLVGFIGILASSMG